MELRKFSDDKYKKTKSPTNIKIDSNNIEELKESDLKNLIEELKTIKPSKPKNIHQGHRSRLKTQFLQNGITSLTDIQKLELLLFFAIPQKDTNPIAHELLDHFGSFKEVVMADHNELMKVKGIKENSALLINLVNAFVNYTHKPNAEVELNTTEITLNYAKNLFYGVSVEQFFVICLNKSGSVKKYVMVSSGSSEEVSVQIRDITKLAIDNKVNRIFICHNHPYGKAVPSDEDIRLTYTIMCSCILNSIDVVDHIIVGNNGELSFHEALIMERLRKKVAENVQISPEKELFLSASAKQYKRSKIVHIDF